MEMLDVVDENNNFTGRIEDREIIHRDGLWHREVAIIIMNENNELLIQKRSANKKQAPNKWCMTSGHIDAGENPLEVVKRETLEELGFELKNEDIEFLFITKKQKKFSDTQYNNNFQYIYYTKTNKKISEYIIQEEELSELKYIPISEFENVVRFGNENYTFSKANYLIDLIEILKSKGE